VQVLDVGDEQGKDDNSKKVETKWYGEVAVVEVIRWSILSIFGKG